MKIVVAIDSFKGSLSSMEAGNACKEGILKAAKAEVVVKPLADGGEGTTEAFVEGMGGDWVNIQVMGPLGNPVNASYGILSESKMAVIEMAAAAGIVVEKQKDVKAATTYGVGEMIRSAVQNGCRNFLIGIGGSATNDCGLGMLTALGVRFYSADGTPVGIRGEDTGKVASVDVSQMMEELAECHFQVACDVRNPLCGENGASYIFGPQKGAETEELEMFNKFHENFAQCTREAMGNDFKDSPGAGAAGGLGFAFLSYLKADLQPGIELVMRAVGMEDELKDADYVITGEGCLDHQTAMGKVPVGVAKLAKKYNIPVIGVAGGVTDGASKCNEEGIDAYFSIMPGVMTLEEAMDTAKAKSNMTNTVEQIFRLIGVKR